MGKSPKTPNDELDKFLLRMPDGLRARLKALAEENGRSMNAEILARLDFTLIAHPHAYLLRALLDLHEKLLSGKEELVVPPGLQDEIRDLALERGVSPQQLLVTLVLQAMNHVDEKTEIGEEFAEHVASMERSDREHGK